MKTAWLLEELVEGRNKNVITTNLQPVHKVLPQKPVNSAGWLVPENLFCRRAYSFLNHDIKKIQVISAGYDATSRHWLKFGGNHK